jgi:adenylyltransferase/sulfurtransferase
MSAAHHVVVFGLGNIGSHAAPLVARIGSVRRITLVDGSRYSDANRRGQHIEPGDVGRAKALVQAKRIRRAHPHLGVTGIVDRLERVPPGLLQGDVILACLDSKEARRAANEVAWRLGVPLIDAGVEASARLARVDVIRPGAGLPCLECPWDDRDYREQQVRHPCDAERPASPATGAPASLGALAASLQAIECEKLLQGGHEPEGTSHQILIEANTHRTYVTRIRRNPRCRFDHQIWPVRRSGAVSVDATLACAMRLGGGTSSAVLRAGGLSLVRQLDCPSCGHRRSLFHFRERLGAAGAACPRCGGEQLAAGMHTLTAFDPGSISPSEARRSLGSLGLREGDILTLQHGARIRCWELSGSRSRGGRRSR